MLYCWAEEIGACGCESRTGPLHHSPIVFQAFPSQCISLNALQIELFAISIVAVETSFLRMERRAKEG